jgi:hypothetical protein
MFLFLFSSSSSSVLVPLVPPPLTFCRLCEYFQPGQPSFDIRNACFCTMVLTFRSFPVGFSGHHIYICSVVLYIIPTLPFYATGSQSIVQSSSAVFPQRDELWRGIPGGATAFFLGGGWWYQKSSWSTGEAKVITVTVTQHMFVYMNALSCLQGLMVTWWWENQYYYVYWSTEVPFPSFALHVFQRYIHKLHFPALRKYVTYNVDTDKYKQEAHVTPIL